MRKVIAMIPAHLQSSRFPDKLIYPILGHPLIAHTVMSAVDSGLFDDVIVATNSDTIGELAAMHRATVIKSVKKHETGSDRIAEAAQILGLHKDDIIVNIQGDQPYFSTSLIKNMIADLIPSSDHDYPVSTAACELQVGDMDNPNSVKVVVSNLNRKALKFTRKNGQFDDSTSACFKHIGLYAFRFNALIDFASMDKTPNENKHKLEQLRLVDNGVPIRVSLSDCVLLDINTIEDVKPVEQALQKFLLLVHAA